MLLIINQEG